MKTQQWVLITGASSGIGYEFAKRFASDGYNLIIVSRRKEKLVEISEEFERLYNIQVKSFDYDLSVNDSLYNLYDDIKSEKIDVEILVNNAGFGNYGFFPETSLDEDMGLMQLNMVALTILTKLFVKDMLVRKSGRIINVASVGGFVPGPFMNTYFASKAYVIKFSVALKNELKNSGVDVNCICPGPTPTNFGKRAHYEHSLKRSHKMPVEDVVKIAYKEAFKGKSIIVPGWKNKAIVLLSKILPEDFTSIIVRKVSGY